MKNLLKIIYSLLVRGPVAFLLGVVQLIFLLLVAIPSILVKLIEKMLKCLRKMNYKEEEDRKHCNPPFPEEVMRRPDPCIYSQTYLAQQGLPVTWNNPDIWMAKLSTPNVIEADSYHLQENTEYIVSVRVHNASTDLALGVKVRLLYRPWSFNSPDLLPVQTNGSGQEVIRYVNVPGMGSSIAQFIWRTPDVPPGGNSHYCIQAHLSHPLDINPSNNLGQENTNVYSANSAHVKAGETLQLNIPLFNFQHKQEAFRVVGDTYEIGKDRKIQLDLKKNVGTEKRPLYRQIANFRPSKQIAGRGKWELSMNRFPIRKVVRARYTGYEELREQLKKMRFPLPEGMILETQDAGTGLMMNRKEQKDIKVTLKVPPQAQTGESYTVNIKALTNNGALVGGVTLSLHVKN